MASQSPLIAQIAAKPPAQQVGILLGVMAALGLLYYQFFYSSLTEDLASNKSAHTRLEKSNRTLKDREREWAQMVKDKASLDLTLSTNQVSLPLSAALPSFIGNMQRQAAVAGVSFKNWSRLAEVPVTGYVKVPISIEVVGTFHQALKYFYLLSKTKRIITVEDFSLTPEKSESDEMLLVARFRATTFRQPDGAAPPPLEAPEASGMIDKAKDARAQKEAQVEAVTGKTDEAGNPVDSKSGLDRLKNPGTQ